jgi:RNA polymerase sigma factor (sigma-70 family)
MHELDDNDLLRQFAEQNSEAAFAALVARHVDKVYSAALRHTRNAHSAEEITQAVFVILAKKSGRLGGKVILAGWLYETARLTAVTYIRSEIRRARREQEAHMQTTLNGGGDASSPLDQDTVWPHIAPLLDDAMAGLSAADRHAIVLRYFDGKSLGEVGAALGASEDAAKKRVTRAVEKLRGYFTKRGVTLTATVLTAAISANSVQAAPLGLATTVTAAAAKGAAVSGSTLTLIKGALKIMAWMKMKTAVAVGVGLLITAGTATVVVESKLHSDAINDPVWNDDAKALEAAPPMVILRESLFSANRAGGIFIKGKMSIRRQQADELIVHAFNWSPVRTVYNTKLPDGFFDYLVTLPEKQEEALQQKLREQLGIVGRFERRQVDTFSIRLLGSPGRGLKPKLSSEYQHMDIDRTNGVLSGVLADIQYSLECYLQAPVSIDVPSAHRYLVELKSDLFKHDSDSNSQAQVEELSKAIKDQLGLEVVPVYTSVEMLVVEKVK